VRFVAAFRPTFFLARLFLATVFLATVFLPDFFAVAAFFFVFFAMIVLPTAAADSSIATGAIKRRIPAASGPE
jgi:hypothetical protein